MKKQIFSMMALMVALVAGLTACSNEDNIENTLSKQKVLINVTESQSFLATDGTPQTGGMTRSLPAEHETGDDIKRGTIFEMNDAIGIFEVSNGQVTKANVPYYFTGQVWDSSSSISFDLSKTYYAYFPYKADLDVSSVVANAATAEAFFANVISGWTVATDQSSYENYKASDLMVGNGTITVNNGIRVVNFQLAHQMGLVVLNLGQVKHMLRSGTYYWFDEVNKKCKVGTENGVTYYKPSYILDEWRAIVPLNTNATFSATDDEWTINAFITQKGHYQLYNIGCTEDDENAGVQYFDLELGDIYYKDGSLMHVRNDNAAARLARQADAEGFVVFISDGTGEDQKVIDPSLDSNGMLKYEYSHGLVMRIKAYDTHSAYADAIDNQTFIGTVTKKYKENHPVKTFSSIAVAVNDCDGIVSTSQVYGTYDAYNDWYDAAHPGPATANVPNSGWFIPGLGQLVHSLLQTGSITQATYNSMIATNNDNNGNPILNAAFSVDVSIWRNYMSNAVGGTTLADDVAFTTSDGWYGLVTSTYYPNANNRWNWTFALNAESAYIYVDWNDTGAGKRKPGYTPMMLAF